MNANEKPGAGTPGVNQAMLDASKSLYSYYNKKYDLELLKSIGGSHPNRMVSFIAMGLAKRLEQKRETVS